MQGWRRACLLHKQHAVDTVSLGQEGLQFVTCKCPLGRQAYAHRVHLGAVDDELVVKMIARGKAGRAHVADDLALPDARARDHTISDFALVIESRLVAVCVIDDRLTAIAAIPTGLFDDTIARSNYRRPSRCRPIDARVRAGVSKYRVASIAETGPEFTVWNRIAQQERPRAATVFVEIADSAVLHLKAIKRARGAAHIGPHEQELGFWCGVVIAIRLRKEDLDAVCLVEA